MLEQEDLWRALRAVYTSESITDSEPIGQSLAACLRRLRRNKLAVAGGSAIILLALLALGADVIAPYHYTTRTLGAI